MKIGFIVEKRWRKKHFGVRNYFSTIADVLSEEHQVDYILYEKSISGIGMWHLYNFRSYYMNTPSTFEIDVEGGFSYATYSSIYKQDYTDKSHTEEYYRCIGSDLGVEKYDVIIITNPWLVDFDFRIPCRKLVGLVYDLVANKYALNGTNTDYEWSFLHNRGYCYYLKYCDEVFAISETVMNEFRTSYKTSKCKYLLPFPPYTYKDVNYLPVKKENAIVLAAPFDLRKGIDRIPTILNDVADLIDVLYIYGKDRCSIDVFNKFFDEIRVNRIKYYPYISSKDLIDLYMKSKILLFPSLEEGLGIPLIEAQLCGCRVITTNKEPMSRLTLPGGYLLNYEKDESCVVGEMMMDETFCYFDLSKDAKSKFSLENVKDIINLEGMMYA